MNKIILSNQIKCLSCGDEIYSAYRHDYKKCECGAVGVDGGMSYLRRIGSNYIDQSIMIDELTYEMCLGALQWCDETERNNLGRLCAIFRALRDCGEI